MSDRLKLIEEIESLAQEKSYIRAENDFFFFCLEFVMTIDEHDKNAPVKHLPMEKEYMKDLSFLFVNEMYLLIEKSRQMMVTWMACAYALWVAMFHEGKRVFIQSKKEKDANATLDRVKFIYQHLPEKMKEKYKVNEPMAYCKMQWGKRNSIIEAIPQGADVLRQYTASLIISDEMAFQERAEEAYIAARPTLTGGGQFIGISSPNFKEFFYRLSKDMIG